MKIGEIEPCLDLWLGSLALLPYVQLLLGAKAEIWNRTNKYGWTPLAIAEGHRPGNFKPSAETIAALQHVMTAAGIALPSTPAPTKQDGPEYKADPAIRPGL